MAPAHTALLTSAYQTAEKDAPTLPLFAYCAVGWYDDQFWVTGFRSDNDVRQDCNQYSQNTVVKRTQKMLDTHLENRLIQHLGKCCLTYGCPAARNYFLGRWKLLFRHHLNVMPVVSAVSHYNPQGAALLPRSGFNLFPVPKKSVKWRLPT